MENGGSRGKTRLFTVFYISLMAICAELCLALMLSLKAYSHMVYVVISFALLGYGLGSNVYLLLGKRINRAAPGVLEGVSLLLISLLTAGVALVLPYLPVNLGMIYHLNTVLSLSVVYGAVALPFTGIGFLISLLFSSEVRESRRLYFWDLLGAGLGAVVFFPLLSAWGPLRTLLLLSVLALVPAVIFLGIKTRARKVMTATIAALAVLEGAALWRPEPDYVIDPGIGWEWIPGYFRKDQYEETWRTWHPLGRTDLHRMKGIEARRSMEKMAPGTFEICIDPRPEFSYFANCYRGGTPVYSLDPDHLRKNGCQVKPFTQPMECPYLLVERPRVLVIGAGGGRDLFMAGVHNASGILGAEINPATYTAMSPGGIAYEYSGRVYTAGGTRVHNIDGRHLVKNQPPGSCDLIILNGIDTFAALSTGAYAFAENYLYTKEAILDYLGALSDPGVLNFNRWYGGDNQPRETLRLFVMALDALRDTGIPDPGKHIVVGSEAGWGIILVKRVPFSGEEESTLLRYFAEHEVRPVYFPGAVKKPENLNPLDKAVAAFRAGTEKQFISGYWADISVVHDDNPFFYKYYKFQLEDTRSWFHPAGGATAFHVQAVIVVQTLVFTLAFILLPLIVARKKGTPLLPTGIRFPFVVYFAALGTGFIFIEITLMQRFTLALGSPMYSISVTLATLLMATGVGSLLSGTFRRWAGSEIRMIQVLGLLVVAYLLGVVFGGTTLLNLLVQAPFTVRIGLSVILLSPLGICLGVFFPSGLLQVGSRSPEAVAWAWGINSGFTVLGSTVTILIAQFLGFNVVLLCAAGFYLAAPLAYRWMSRGLQRNPE